MRVFSGLRELEVAGFYGVRSVVTIGNFDGVHCGHRELIRRACSRAHIAQVRSVVVTFDPHPLSVLRPELKLKRLFDSLDRQEQIERAGADVLVIEPFSRSFSQLSPLAFLEEMILQPFSPLALVVGYDFSFGANRSGSIDFLTEQSRKVGFEVDVVAPVSVQLNGEDTVVSSTRIRLALESGDAAAARGLLGRPYELRGRVMKGAGRGRSIGIPTANIDPSIEPAIRPGVYAGWARARGERYQALINIGKNPTFVDSTNAKLNVEAHLPGFLGGVGGSDLYGEELAIEFIDRLRDERKFLSVAELVEQIGRDIADGISRLNKSLEQKESSRED